MEKSKVASSAVKKQGNKNGKDYTIYEIHFENGMKGDSFDKVEQGQEVEFEVVPNSNPAYNPTIKIKKPSGGSGRFTPRDYTFDKRRVALECAVSLVNSGKVGADKLVETREKFFTYLEGGAA